MLRISGIVLPGRKRIEISLTAIKGIGRPLSRTILEELGINFDMHADDLSETEAARLRARVEKELTEGELMRKISMDVKRLQDIGTWRGYRHPASSPSAARVAAAMRVRGAARRRRVSPDALFLPRHNHGFLLCSCRLEEYPVFSIEY